MPVIYMYSHNILEFLGRLKKCSNKNVINEPCSLSGTMLICVLFAVITKLWSSSRIQSLPRNSAQRREKSVLVLCSMFRFISIEVKVNGLMFTFTDS